MTLPKTPARQKVYRLSISLKYDCRIWRTVLVEGGVSLDELHRIIQAVMGWDNYHMHCFVVRGRRYGEGGGELGFEDEADVTLSDLVSRSGQKLEYEYDFGDSWWREIRVEKIIPPTEALNYPVCIAGERACPPEDCGGLGGYQRLLQILNDPAHPEHKEMLEWVGGSFDPELFDLAEANIRLRPLRPSARRE